MNCECDHGKLKHELAEDGKLGKCMFCPCEGYKNKMRS